MPIAQINGHDMYYEVHGDGPPAVYIGGWDTFCHGRHHYLARGMTDQFSTVIIDYRGLGESTDDYSVPASTQLFADDIIALLEFPVLFLGTAPAKTPALYSLMTYSGIKYGTFYPMGGFGKVIDGMVDLCKELGVKFKTNHEVKKINVENKRVVSLTTSNKNFKCDARMCWI